MEVDPKLIEFLLNPDNYPEEPHSIEHYETHISHVFVGDSLVYKIKKPVNLGFLDFTTLEKRHFFCREEVRLNSRLAADLYLGVEYHIQRYERIFFFETDGLSDSGIRGEDEESAGGQAASSPHSGGTVAIRRARAGGIEAGALSRRGPGKPKRAVRRPGIGDRHHRGKL